MAVNLAEHPQQSPFRGSCCLASWIEVLMADEESEKDEAVSQIDPEKETA
jgi:hypothetical protein